ncbi:FAD binding domain-containing [Fusarium albosuccineum]|uniref:FAD binding domain-containing n=1 Tax=Fusarium albosuccineum TaxID=1237068 RepID=A0A8H4P561_9HYPO|nr:FAD binding domain-containing [Fusarium albosuccineum]
MHAAVLRALVLVLGAFPTTLALPSRVDYDQPVQDHAFAALKKAEDTLSNDERKEYIRAVKCLISSPAKTDPDLKTGVRVRYDDFAAQHINQTLSVHVTGNFLTWHRHYIWSYEKALRDECGYTGYLPYWNWFSHQDDLRKSPVFDGSETSVGSDGVFVQHNGSTGSGGLHIPSGLGGGCIESGPFANLSANLGPVQPQQDGIIGLGTENKLQYNPHCVQRDLSSWLATRIYTKEAFLNATVRETAKDIASFQAEIDNQSSGLPGVHAGGHQTISGSNSDLYSGVVDPAFYLHHTMVDRIYWLWQALHLDQAKTISGTITIGNNPPSRNATLDDLIELPYLGVKQEKLGDLLDTLDGPYCYIYA